ncbi:MAG TPA: CapA family protein [Pyrinomonadaceae bacterium]|jgi:poly-gamma-glutamate capsule biosynthesis protein CapA/YwtB (metallophosphatase superfamily)|nr:CapA family protein [Pyrinomonadaceae bacterium]
MLAPKWLTLLSATSLMAAILLTTACNKSNAQPERVYSAAPAPVVQVSPTPSVQSEKAISITAVGDIMLGSTYPDSSSLPPEDGARLLTEVTPILSATDIAFGNLEGPMLEGGTTNKCSPTSTRCFAFRVPTRYGKHLKDAGFDIMSLANNHASDFGAGGRESSKRVLQSLGIAHAGADTRDTAFLNIKGKKIAVVAFATNNVSYNLNDVETARRAVLDAAAKSDLVIVSFHGGAEGPTNQHVPRGPEVYLGEARGDLRKFTHAVVDAGADLVIGHGPHVVRGMEVYRNRLIAYSLGNFATYGKFQLVGATSLSLILEAEIAPDGAFLGGRIHPALQTKPGGPRLDSNGSVIPVIRQLSADDFGPSAVRVSVDGTISAP